MGYDFDPALDRRRLTLYFGALGAVYALGLWARNAWGFDVAVLLIMYAPLVGALVARFAGPGRILWRWPSWWLLAALLPVALPLLVQLLGSAVGLIEVQRAVLFGALTAAPLGLLSAGIGAFGEEVGWRGFLWPLMRARMAFLAATGTLAVIWLAYHVPFIVLGDYGTVAGLPAFSVAIVGFTLFVGVLTDRSASLWPSVMAHAGWNALVADSFAGAFTGNGALLGEFGWLPAAAILALGVGAAVWHLRGGYGAATLLGVGNPEGEATPRAGRAPG